MATLTITTTPKQDAAAQYMTQQFNAHMNPPAPLTPMQFAQNAIRELLDGWVARADTDQRISKAAAYQNASPDDQATIDAILAKYGA